MSIDHTARSALALLAGKLGFNVLTSGDAVVITSIDAAPSPTGATFHIPSNHQERITKLWGRLIREHLGNRTEYHSSCYYCEEIQAIDVIVHPHEPRHSR